MINEKEWKKWIELVNSYTEYHNVRELSEKEIIKSMLKFTVNAECVVTCFVDEKGFKIE